MFPTSDDGADVQNTLIREAESRGARIALRARVNAGGRRGGADRWDRRRMARW